MICAVKDSSGTYLYTNPPGVWRWNVANNQSFLNHNLLIFSAVSALALLSLVSMPSFAQDSAATCPCFSYEEVEAIFLQAEQLREEEGTSDCSVEDYSVECNAEVIVWDQDYNIVAQARVDWFDYDPSGCEYTNTSNDPDVERSVSWPHPAPEATARACLMIISRVIKKFDTSGKCNTYP